MDKIHLVITAKVNHCGWKMQHEVGILRSNCHFDWRGGSSNVKFKDEQVKIKF